MKTILKCFMWSCLFLLVQIIVSAFGGIVIAIKYGGDLDLVMRYTMAFIFISGIIFVGIVALSKRNSEMGLFETCRFKKIDSKEIIFATVTGIAAIYTIQSIVGMVSQYFKSYESVSAVISEGSTDYFGVFVLVIAVPIIEEIVFRGFLFNKLREKIDVRMALVVQALLFGFVHLNLLQGLYAMFLGLLLGAFYLRRESIIAPIIIHIVCNFFGSVGTGLLLKVLSEEIMGMIVIGSYILMIVSIVIIIKDRKNMFRKRVTEEISME